ncbi:MAG: hypothetical protein AABX84_01550 [Nanoarchaeota archaeon]
MVQEKLDIEKKMDNLDYPLRHTIENKALNALIDELWCKRNGMLFVKDFNPWKGSSIINYSNPNERRAVEIMYEENRKEELEDSKRMYSRIHPKLPLQ